MLTILQLIIILFLILLIINIFGKSFNDIVFVLLNKYKCLKYQLKLFCMDNIATIQYERNNSNNQLSFGYLFILEIKENFYKYFSL